MGHLTTDPVQELLIDSANIIIDDKLYTDVIKKLNPKKYSFFLIGSRASGEYRPDSDYDYVLALDEKTLNENVSYIKETKKIIENNFKKNIETEEIKRRAKKIYDYRMKKGKDFLIEGKSIDDFLKKNGIKPMTDESEKYMRQWDLDTSKKEKDDLNTDVTIWIKPIEQFENPETFRSGTPENIKKLDGFSGLFSKGLLFEEFSNHKHLSGTNVFSGIDDYFNLAKRTDGYELWIKTTRDLAKGIMNKDSGTLAKAVLNSVYALHLLAGRNYLPNYTEKAREAEILLPPIEEHDQILKQVKKAERVKIGKDQYNFNKRELKDLNLFFLFIKNKIDLQEFGIEYLFDEETNKNISEYYRRTQDEIINLFDKNRDNKDFLDFSRYFLDDMISYYNRINPNKETEKPFKLVKNIAQYYTNFYNNFKGEIDTDIEAFLGKTNFILENYDNAYEHLEKIYKTLNLEKNPTLSSDILNYMSMIHSELDKINISLQLNPLNSISWKIKADITKNNEYAKIATILQSNLSLDKKFKEIIFDKTEHIDKEVSKEFVSNIRKYFQEQLKKDNDEIKNELNELEHDPLRKDENIQFKIKEYVNAIKESFEQESNLLAYLSKKNIETYQSIENKNIVSSYSYFEKYLDDKRKIINKFKDRQRNRRLIEIEEMNIISKRSLEVIKA